MSEEKISKIINNSEQILIQKNYELMKDNKSYKIEVCEISDKILIKHINYKVKLSYDEISKITKILFNSIDEAYKYIENLFNKNKVIIKDVLVNDKIKLNLYIYDSINDNEKEIEIDLVNESQNKDYIIIDLINKYNKLENEVNSLKNEINSIKEEMVILKSYHKDNINKSELSVKENTNINDMKHDNKDIIRNDNNNTEEKNETGKNKVNVDENNIKKDGKKLEENSDIKMEDKSKINKKEMNIDLVLLNEVTTNSYCSNIEDNTFCIFYSFKDNSIPYLIYSTKEKSIICYNFIEKKIKKEIQDPHKGEYITNYRHCVYNNTDIIMSLSLNNNMLKLWDFPSWNCILQLEKIYMKGYLYSACFLNHDINTKENYIITSSIGNNEPIKIFDFNGSLIKKFDQNSSEDVYFIDSYFNKSFNKFYVITGNNNYIKTYNFYETKLYKKYMYSFDDTSGSHSSCVINDKNNDNIIKLIDICYGNDIIYIWNFHTGDLLNKISTDGIGLVSCCLWDENYFFVGCRDRTIKLINISQKEAIKSLKGHKNWVSCIKKFKHPEYGECLISQADLDDQIKLWSDKSYLK